jgi:hypothetical protein
MKLRAVLFLATVISHIDAVAEDRSFGATAGMLGLGLVYAYPLSERLVIRGGINGSSYSFDRTKSGIDYELDINWESASVALDFHPNRGALRLSFGFLKNGNSLLTRSRVSENVTVGGVTYTLTEENVTVGGVTYTLTEIGTLRGEFSFNRIAPFIGMGWDWSRNKRFGITFDFGVVSQGSPTVSLSADGPLLGSPMFLIDLVAEEAKLKNAFGDLDSMPFVTFGLMFRF